MQKEKVIAYTSRQVKIHEKNYTTHNLELEAVLFALKMWRYYLYVTKCVVFTDHKSLQHVLDQMELNRRQHRWLELLSDYDYEIRYHPRKANVVADAFSRKERIKLLRVRALVMTIGLDLPLQILNAQAEVKKEDNYEAEDLCSMVKKLEPQSDGTLRLNTRSLPVCWYNLRCPNRNGKRSLMQLSLDFNKKFYNSLGSAPNRCSVVLARLGGLDLPLQILNAQAEVKKEDNYEAEDLCSMVKKLEPQSDGTLCLKKGVGYPVLAT
uniref:Putative reverse transcriptase domain-containing protein n=1 Tax=Tanacetum cinerariifolium TaxID=118510 RepID=A0A699JBU3_TANCI|nr:putative reverse transcriptase domain-containing protein [Tanacetum cinerariifolium]